MGLLDIRNIRSEAPQQTVEDAHLGVSCDYLFSAKRSKKGSDYIYMKVWVFITCWQGHQYQQYGFHTGDYMQWQELILKRIEHCLLTYSVDPLQTKRMLREIEPSKDKMIMWDENMNGIIR
ncbi:hypothetical protein [Autumnicola musiva]|uniref:Uncharacterized protein n=1 Tax=Autumnicola musiva TaxID=3075589 RepID=A0ABU3D4Y8_9FLAO|nr:hypothetical protein [Zunongwangia sp. F117]MDT0676603.1 hypothetical protein [Zunongwangia sp. F117]